MDIDLISHSSDASVLGLGRIVKGLNIHVFVTVWVKKKKEV